MKSRPSHLFAVLLALVANPQEERVPPDILPAELPSAVPLGLPAAILGSLGSDEVAALGRRLFFDPILSSDRSVACATCHDPAHGFADPRPRSLGVHGRETLRNAPTLFNRALGESFLWDGRADTLEEQVLLPIENELEMDLRLDEAVRRLEADYAEAFRQSLGTPPSRDGLSEALAGFVRRIWRGNAPIDRFRNGDIEAMEADARGGMWLFESRGGCWRCHVGSNFTDEAFHNTGVGAIDGEPEEGRSAVTGLAGDLGRFKTPTLRGLRDTAPYMHDGSLATLEDVVEFYRKGGHPNVNLDPVLKPIEMTEEDAAKLVAFLASL